jgi:alpha-L-fucosidase
MTVAPLLAALLLAPPQPAAPDDDVKDVKAEHRTLQLADSVDKDKESTAHTEHPDAQWFPEATLGLFIHWGLSSVRAINLSWPMMAGRGQAGQPQITPNEYWTQAETFNPQKYDPDKWMKAAKSAGFTYAVFTTRHHEGFAMWPSAFGDFNTKKHMGGRDLVKPFVEACRRNGLKVGLYYSPPDWYFDRDYQNFNRKAGDTVALDADHRPRAAKRSPEETARHRAAYVAMVRGQIEELLTRYGKIDLLWFDGKIPNTPGDEVITQERIRALQPGIVINPRLHGHGDFKTYERQLKTDQVAQGWAEFCNTWTNYWPHVAGAPFRAPGFVLGQLVSARALHINYLLSVGPTADGELVDEVYANIAAVGAWMKKNGRAVRGAQPLPAGEQASVPATAAGNRQGKMKTRYLFALPKFAGAGTFEKDLQPPEDATLTLTAAGAGKPRAVRLLGGPPLKHSLRDGTLTITLPARQRTKLVDVVEVDL